ncbi:MAG: hypothetical protein IT337_07220 [Thermomicrobiales bacterium]|nr:hypothetical protein [Thermomicrobiales bacterium]
MAVWLENDAQWHEERMLHCALCGRMIAKRFLRESFAHGDEIFCGDDCLTLYHDYWLVERGPGYRPPEGIDAAYAERMVM